MSVGDTVSRVRGTAMADGARMVLGALMGVVIARTLAPEGRGHYAILVTISSVASIAGNLSIGQVAVSWWDRRARVIPSTVVRLSTLLGLAATATALLLVLALGPIRIPIVDATLFGVALAVVMPTVLLTNLVTVTVLLGRIEVANRALLISAVLQTVALLVLSVAGLMSVAVVIWSWAIGAVLPLLWLWPVVRPHVVGVSSDGAWRMAREGAQYHAGTLIFFLMRRVDVLILNGLAPGAPVGLYTLAVSLGETALAGTTAIAQAMVARQAAGDLESSGHLTLRAMRVAVLMSVASTLGLVVLAPVVVPFFYGDAFRESVPALWALAPGLAVFGPTRVLHAYLLRLGRPLAMSGLSAAALVIVVVLNWWWIPQWGIVGCALAASVGYVGLGIAHIVWATRSLGVTAWSVLPGREDWRLVRAAMRAQVTALARPSR